MSRFLPAVVIPSLILWSALPDDQSAGHAPRAGRVSSLPALCRQFVDTVGNVRVTPTGAGTGALLHSRRFPADGCLPAVCLPCGSSIQRKVGRGLHIPTFDYPQRRAFSDLSASRDWGVHSQPPVGLAFPTAAQGSWAGMVTTRSEPPWGLGVG